MPGRPTHPVGVPGGWIRPHDVGAGGDRPRGSRPGLAGGGGAGNWVPGAVPESARSANTAVRRAWPGGVREYRRRTVLLLACWLLGYSGLVYGVIGFLNLYLARVFSARAVFISGLISGVVGGAAGLLAAARLNERVER